MARDKVIVTGGCGFIGSHLVEALKLNNEVVVIDDLSTGRIENLAEFYDHNITFIEADISDPCGKWMQAFKGAKTVYHLAALADIVPSIKDPQSYFKANVTGTLNVLQACHRFGVNRLTYTASSSCYGIPDQYPTNEVSRIDTRYPYALTKYLGEELVLHWCKVYGVSAVSCRLFNVYGPRSRTSGTYGAVFGVFLAQKLAQKPFTIVGDGMQTRDFTFVTDVVRALQACALKGPPGAIYNVGSGNSVSVNYLAELLGGDKIFIPKRPGEPDCTFADITKITTETDWRPSVSIEDGVRQLLMKINYWKSAPVWDPSSITEATKEWFEYLNDD